MTAAPVIVAGAGIAGLTAALALSAKGFHVRILEAAPTLSEAGAGLQLSPNATRILSRLGVLDGLAATATRPAAVAIRSAANLATLAEIPLGESGVRRWGAPYLAVHRADLQAALLAAVAKHPAIALEAGATVTGFTGEVDCVAVDLDGGPAGRIQRTPLLVGADGVWSKTRAAMAGGGDSRFSGKVAYRATIDADGAFMLALGASHGAPSVQTFLHPGFHLVTYPMRAGALVNLVAVAPADSAGRHWGEVDDASTLFSAMRGIAPALDRLVRSVSWTAWPVHVAPASTPWTEGGRVALVGDAAHAMTPFAAQGAAMAIEDAAVLAACIAEDGITAAALHRYEVVRKPRVARVARRGRLNGFAWHARGPFAIGRDMVLRLSGGERLTAQLDWLYGHDASRLP